MRRSSNVFLGAILIVVGVIFMAFNYDLIDFDLTFRKVAQFWPVLLILAGLAVLLHERRSFYNPTTALLVAFAIPLAIYSMASNGVRRLENKIGEDFDFKWDDDDNSFEYDWKESEGGDAYESEERNYDNGSRTEQDFAVPFNSKSDKVKLHVGGGAAEFHLEDSPKDVFGARTLLNAGSYQISDELRGNSHDIDFEMKKRKNKSFHFGDGDNNEVFLKLNKKPLWDIELGIGAGDLDFDLSPYKVEKLEINTGAAAIKVKLGDMLKESHVDVESGVAKVSLSVPQNVGCEIRMDGALNAKDFDGFEKQENSHYRTSNFDTADKKIYISVSSGLSSVSVDRY
ncbi:DUF5668 domain-containing protein [Marinilongibacter aquaticus]|uniref:LiaI-LiaF-like domain-containing protein n=1 Tax=Marinilongibacter aquaticus TaxID=2975157 RepID=UPI0021BD2572|nr:DUF5668 domain-containing protein [Marinilongibacter aquaticus]UBM59438.1 DUF5668 domain-containing protein [Marinilongibacter aquaticus]